MTVRMTQKRTVVGVVVWAALAGGTATHAQWSLPFEKWEFTQAILKDDRGRTQAILQGQTNVNARYEEGLTFLHAAAYWGKTNAIALLLAKGAQTDLPDQDGRTPLHYASLFNPCEMGCTIPPELQRAKQEACRQLIRAGARVNARDHEGMTPLLWTLRLTFVHPVPEAAKDICELLVSEGADVTSTNHEGKTALHEAAEYGATNACLFLIAKGAKVTAADSNGLTPLHEAVSPSLLSPDQNEVVAICDALIAGGADVNALDTDGRSPLDVAVGRDLLKVCAFLVARDAQVRQQTLALARMRKQREIIELLERHEKKPAK